MSSTISDKKRFLNGHNIMFGFALFFIIVAFIWLVGLCGAQTGSSTTSGFGSIVLASQGDNGDVSSTYEVVAQVFITLFLILGIGMLTYVMTVKKSAEKLIDAGEYKAAIIINGNNKLTSEDIEKLNKEQAKNLVRNLGLPSNTLSRMGESSRRAGKYVYDAAGYAYNRAIGHGHNNECHANCDREKVSDSEGSDSEGSDSQGYGSDGHTTNFNPLTRNHVHHSNEHHGHYDNKKIKYYNRNGEEIYPKKIIIKEKNGKEKYYDEMDNRIYTKK
jgi:hypothetical protein